VSEDKNSGDKTEKATPHRLKEARKKGDIAKGRDLTSTLTLAFSLGLIYLVWQYCTGRVVVLSESIFVAISHNSHNSLQIIGDQAITTFLVITAILVLPALAIGLIVEFLQTGAVFAAEKIKPKMSHLNFVEGFKRMFSMDNFVDLLKNIIKALVLGSVIYFLIRSALGELVLLPGADIYNVGLALSSLTIKLLAWVMAFFLFLTILDTVYRHHSFAKKMRMSMRDIKKEHKDNEGDPMVKGQRRQIHKEWNEQSATSASEMANALIVNPTHVAIAIHYNEEEQPVPLVAAKGQEHVAQAMRDAANDNNVPVVRNEHLARTLLANVEEGDPVPEGLFDIIAEVIFWAKQVSQNISDARQNEALSTNPDDMAKPPGEDLTQYPQFMLEDE